ncbi:nuclear transport factor 2 family protein [Chitinophaga japonensis]|uniref:Putative lumazine-binding protein n=1 Tax=Chitinophaga japonensis TaxID=104662 RepID=A0A562T4U3_CHIJA|nr:nuclear transport factor 2 family protein [Chitinophaga japonensis]TWI88076.1 putative lumazine-binding protein [Chitinophaga japonensis]
MTTQLTHEAAISQRLEAYYFQGSYEGDLNKLKQIFHPGTRLFGDVKGQPYSKTLDEWLEVVANRQHPKDSGKPFKGEILSIKAVNSVAVAEVQVTAYDMVYHDFLSLHRIDGKWVIVSKIMSGISQ